MTDIAGERRRLADIGFTYDATREQWGARFDYTDARTVTRPADHLFLHITVTNPDSYPSEAAHQRAIESIGISRFPSTGISYNANVHPSGRIFEAQPLTRRGAHTYNDLKVNPCSGTGCPNRGSSLNGGGEGGYNLNYNARALGLAQNVGDPVTDAQIDKAARWGAALILSGEARSTARWHGHRDVAAKACPGDKAWARMGDLQRLTTHYVQNGLEDDMTPEECRAVVREEISNLTYDMDGYASRLFKKGLQGATWVIDAQSHSASQLLVDIDDVRKRLSAIEAKLGSGSGGSLTKADLDAALAPFRSLLPGE